MDTTSKRREGKGVRRKGGRGEGGEGD